MVWVLSTATLLVALVILWVSKEKVMFWFLTPKAAFDPENLPPAPDYSDPACWGAWPGTNGPAERVPQGEDHVPEADRKADVFFVHATSFLSPSGWNADIADADTNAVTDAFNIAGQASVFNKAGRIYAPRFRQATLAAMANWNDVTEKVVTIAYQDIAAAFDHFLENIDDDAPLILAAHSQGSCHLLRLLVDRVIGTPIADRVVAIYLPGVWLPQEYAATVLARFPLATDQGETGCILSWDTYLEGSKGRRANEGAIGYWTGNNYQLFEPRVLAPVSPVGGAVAPSDMSAHKGAVAPVATSLGAAKKFGGGTGDQPLDKPVAQQVATRPSAGGLMVSKAADKRLGRAMPGSGSLHPIDINLFFIDIREDAARRVDLFCNR